MRTQLVDGPRFVLKSGTQMDELSQVGRPVMVSLPRGVSAAGGRLSWGDVSGLVANVSCLVSLEFAPLGGSR